MASGDVVAPGEPIALPPLAPGDRSRAHRWVSFPGIGAVGRIRSRGNVVYVASNPEPLRIDWKNSVYSELARPSDASLMAQDVLAPLGGGRLVTVFASASGSNAILLSNDDGSTWTAGSAPAPPSSVTSAMGATLVSLPDSNAKPGRAFLTSGGTTLDVSDDGGQSWSRVVDGGATPAQGLTLDHAGATLWCVTEGALDRVVAYSMRVSQDGALPQAWSGQILSGWDANGVYSAEMDPFDAHAIYIGGEGRLGYVEPALDGATASVELRWSAVPDAAQYTYIWAISPSSSTPNDVVFGGGEQGGGPARVLEVSNGGAEATEIALDGAPEGTVRGIVEADARLLFFVDTGSSLDVYAIDR
jgi:hypothetical protein